MGLLFSRWIVCLIRCCHSFEMGGFTGKWAGFSSCVVWMMSGPFMIHNLGKFDWMAFALWSSAGNIERLKVQLGQKLSSPINTHCLFAVSKERVWVAYCGLAWILYSLWAGYIVAFAAFYLFWSYNWLFVLAGEFPDSGLRTFSSSTVCAIRLACRFLLVVKTTRFTRFRPYGVRRRTSRCRVGRRTGSRTSDCVCRHHLYFLIIPIFYKSRV